MCLITTTKLPAKAEEDIIIYKWLYKSDTYYIAPLYRFKYMLGTTYYESRFIINSDIIRVKKNGNIIYRDFYGNPISLADEISSEFYRNVPSKELRYVTYGYHSYLSPDRNVINHHTLLQGIIPKGALYIKDETGLIASNSIKLIKEFNYES